MRADLTSVVAIVNTLEVDDGGPARYAEDLHAAMVRSGTLSRLIDVRGGSPTRLLSAFAQVGRSTHVILHGYYLPWVPTIALIARLQRKHISIVPHGSLTVYDRSKSRRKKRVFEVLFRSGLARAANQFVAMSSRERTEMLPYAHNATVAIVGAGTQTPQMSPKKPRSDEIELLCISRIAPKKRIDICLDAIAILRTRGVSVRLTIAGRGDSVLTQQLEQQALRLGIADAVRFVGTVRESDRERVFASADVLLLPSEDENFGLTVAEAAVRGVMSVVSDKVDAVEWLPESMYVKLRQCGPANLADGIEQAMTRLTDPSYPERVARAGADAFDWDQVAERWHATMLGSR